jgi:ribosomal protein S27AE
MKLLLPLHIAEGVLNFPLMHRPQFLALAVPESPPQHELMPNLIFYEVRGGYLKWVHLICPKCGEHIQLPMAGKEHWSLKIDFLRRPTIAPSIWETQSCGAHFFIRKGDILWCQEGGGLNKYNGGSIANAFHKAKETLYKW